jgi:hypothetical protein
MNREPSPLWRSEQQPHSQQPFGQPNWDHQTPYDPSTLPTSPLPRYQAPRPYQQGQSQIEWSTPSPHIPPYQAPKRPPSRILSIKKTILYVGIAIILLGLLEPIAWRMENVCRPQTVRHFRISANLWTHYGRESSALCHQAETGGTTQAEASPVQGHCAS